MLGKIERFYLDALRVIILIGATAALVVASFAIFSAASYFAGQAGFAQSAEGGDLAAFIAEQRSMGMDVTAPEANTPTEIAARGSASIRASAKRIADYMNKHHSANAKADEIARLIVDRTAELPPGYARDYEASLDQLTSQLEQSKGRPLSSAKIGEMLDWHDQQFRQAVAEKEARNAEGAVGTLTAIATAGSAFLIFTFLVFCFLFVRIERNLRIVRVATAEEGHHEAA